MGGNRFEIPIRGYRPGLVWRALSALHAIRAADATARHAAHDDARRGAAVCANERHFYRGRSLCRHESDLVGRRVLVAVHRHLAAQGDGLRPARLEQRRDIVQELAARCVAPADPAKARLTVGVRHHIFGQRTHEDTMGCVLHPPQVHRRALGLLRLVPVDGFGGALHRIDTPVAGGGVAFGVVEVNDIANAGLLAKPDKFFGGAPPVVVQAPEYHLERHTHFVGQADAVAWNAFGQQGHHMLRIDYCSQVGDHCSAVGQTMK